MSVLQAYPPFAALSLLPVMQTLVVLPARETSMMMMSPPHHGRNYLECLDQVAARVIAASGFQKSRLARYDRDCTIKTYDPSSCSVFSNDRNGAGTEWCQRVDEANIKVCAQASGRSATTPGPTKNGTQRKSSDRGSQSQSKGVKSDPSKVGPSKGGIRTNCHNVQCALGACNQLCSPPL